MEKRIPHYVQFVNEKVFSKVDHKDHELDLICKNAIIEIKSGKNSKYLTQLLQQRAIAESRHLKHVLYAPNIKYNALRQMENNGIVIARTLEDLYKEIKK